MNWALATPEIVLAVCAMAILVFGVLRKPDPAFLCTMLALGALVLAGVLVLGSEVGSAYRGLFVVDGFSATHHHLPGHCGLTAGEQPIPEPAMMRAINELALQWTRYTDSATTFADLDDLLTLLRPRMIAPAHGAVIDQPDAMIPLIKRAMCGQDDIPLSQAAE